MSAELRVRAMTAADWPRVRAGFSRVFLHAPAPSVWAWKYRVHDAQGWRGWLAETTRQEVVAFLGATVQWALVDGAQVRVLRGSDSFSHPDWRSGAKRAPYVQVERAFHADQSGFAALGVGFGLDRRMRLGVLGAGLQQFTAGDWLQSAVAYGLGDSSCSVQLAVADFQDRRWDRTWAMRQRQVPWGLVRDQAFLAWRFDGRQGTRYWALGIENSCTGHPLGYAVLRPVEDNEAMLVDVVLPVLAHQARDAWTQLQTWLWRQGIRRVRTYLSHACPEWVLLVHLGWTASPAAQPVVPGFSLYDVNLSAQQVQARYALTLADTDLY